MPLDAPQTDGANLDSYFEEAGKRFDLDPDLLRSQAKIESKNDPYAVSPTSALGVMQVEPDTYNAMRQQYRDIGPNPFNARDNIMAGAAYLRQMQDQYGPQGGLAAYNAGPQRYERHLAGDPLPDETSRYVSDVVGDYASRKAPKEAPAQRGPWQDYQQAPQQAAPSRGPWEDYKPQPFIPLSSQPSGLPPIPDENRHTRAGLTPALTEDQAPTHGGTPTPTEMPAEAGGAGWTQDPISGAFMPPAAAPYQPQVAPPSVESTSVPPAQPTPYAPLQAPPLQRTEAPEIPAEQGMPPQSLPVQPGSQGAIANTALARIGEAAATGAVENFGDDALGLSGQSAAALRRAGVFPQSGQGPQPIRQLNEAILRPIAIAADTLWRAGGAMFGAQQGAIQQAAKEAGLSDAASRDLAAYPEAFMGSPHLIGVPLVDSLRGAVENRSTYTDAMGAYTPQFGASPPGRTFEGEIIEPEPSGQLRLAGPALPPGASQPPSAASVELPDITITAHRSTPEGETIATAGTPTSVHADIANARAAADAIRAAKPPSATPVLDQMAAAAQPPAAPRTPAQAAQDAVAELEPQPPAPVQQAPAAAAPVESTPPPQTAPPEVAGQYTMLKPGQITLRPDLFQFKQSDTRGITGALSGVTRWEPDLADPITAWQSNDGSIVAVNGHQRTDLAQRAEAAGQPDVQVPARVFREANGYTPAYMRVLGAYQNIAQGSGTPMDAARVFRGDSDIPEGRRLPNLPPQQAMVQQGRGLAALSQDAFGMVEAGAVPPTYAALVGEAIRDPAEQISALQVIQHAAPANAEQARIMVRDIQQSGFLQAQDAAQGDIFGTGAPPIPVFAERARVLANAMQTLRRNRTVFGAAVKGEDTLTAVGNRLNAAANAAGRTDNERLLARLETDATKRGPLSEALTAAATDVAAGKPVAAVTSQFLARARAIERGAEDTGVRPSAVLGGDRPAQATEEPVAPTPGRIRTLDDIQVQDKVGPRKAAEIQATEIEAAGRPITDEERAARSVGLAMPIDAFHGTPHEFERFDTAKIGTGEGAQAYGHGLYFAESSGVARRYAAKVGHKALIDLAKDAYGEGDSPEDAEESLFEQPMTDRQRRALNALKADDWLGFDYPHQAIRAAIREPHNFDISPETVAALKDRGDVLTVRINAEPEEMLDWNKPLSEQSPQIQAALQRMDKVGTDPQAWSELAGDWYKGNAGDEDGAKALSAALRAAGVKGIRYLDQGSRQVNISPIRYADGRETWGVYLKDHHDKPVAELPTKAEAEAEAVRRTTRNIVVFDHNDVEITHRNGEPVKPTKMTEDEAHGLAEQQGLAQPRRLPTPPSTGPDLFGTGRPESATRAAPEPTIRTDQRQAVMPGMGPSAVQAQAARDQAGRGGINPRGAVRPADEGLFKPQETPQPELGAPEESEEEAINRQIDAETAAHRAVYGGVKPGEVLLTKSGRQITVPHFTLRSSRAILAKWLVSEAQKEAPPASLTRWEADAIREMDWRNLSPTDSDLLRETLFGDVNGPGPKNRPPPRSGNSLAEFDRFAQSFPDAPAAAVAFPLDRGRATGHEYMTAYDPATGAVVSAHTAGHDYEVAFTREFEQLAEDPRNTLVVYHNHPGGRSLSPRDIGALRLPGLRWVVALGHDGAFHAVRLGPAIRDLPPAEAAHELTKASNLVYKELKDFGYAAVARGDVTIDDANATFADIMNRALHQGGIIDYMTTGTIPQRARTYAQAAMQAAIEGTNVRLDRPAFAIRPDEGIARVLAEARDAAAGRSAGARGETAGRGRSGGPPPRSDLREDREPLNRVPLYSGTSGDAQESGERLYSFPGMLIDPAVYRRAIGPIAGPAKAIVHWANEATQSIANGLAPMRAGSRRAQAFAGTFANALRQVQYRFGQIDKEIERNFTPRERDQMGRALDAQSVFEQQARDMAPAEVAAARAAFDSAGTGLAGLNPAQRNVVEMLNILSEDTWRQMQAREMVRPEAKGLPYYFPRQMVRWSDAEGFTRASGQGGGSNRGIDQRGANLTTAGPMRREHLTPEETEEAARAVLGRDTSLLRDIRSLPQRLAFAHRAIAGVDLMNKIEEIGRQVGVNLVVRGDIPGLLNPADYFTMSDHPSFRTWAGTGWRAVHVAREFEGPLRAVLTQPSPTWFKASQQIKGGVMNAIMWSPFIHLQVELGRAAPLIIQHPVMTMRSLIAAHNLRRDLSYMDTATTDGLAPLGQGWHADPVSIADDAFPADRNRFIRALSAARDAMANGARSLGGETLHDIVQHPHQTLLWDQVFNLQVGLYDSLRSLWMRKGFPPDVAGTMAAHIANRYAGALPPEHLSKAANMAANLLLFSRSFTLGNLGVMKDMFTGAPPHVRARIEQMTTPEMAKSATSAMRRKAVSAVVMDIGLFFLGNALLQLGMQTLRNSPNAVGLPKSAQETYDQWLDDATAGLRGARENPLDAFGVFPQHWNEPGKQNRAYAGQDSTGRGIYVRLATGKVGEEFLGWPTNPAAMVLNKSSPLVRPVLEALMGTDTLGHHVYNPDPRTLGDYAEIAGNVVQHFGGDLGPTSLIQGSRELYQHFTSPKPQDHPWVSAAKIVGPATGLGLISQGFPGGPAAGELHAETERERFAQERAMPAIRQKILAGDVGGAEADMFNLRMPKELIKYYVIQTLRPGPSSGSLKRLPTLPPAVQERVQRDLARP